MSYSIHICTVGFRPEPSLAFMKHGMPIDKMYLLNSEGNKQSDESERIIREKLSMIGIDTVTLCIDPLDFEQIYDTMLSILDRESGLRDAKYYINFTNGTRVMSAAVVSAAFLMNSELYYVLNEEDHPELNADRLIRHYNVFNFPDMGSIKGPLKDVFLAFSGKELVYNRNLKIITGMSPSGLRRYTKKLEEMDLIRGERDGKETIWHLTDLGSSVLKRLYKPIDTSSTDKGWLSSNSKKDNPPKIA